MYSRDIFPKYAAGGLPIPENYSGNAIRRTPVGGGSAPPTRVHTPPRSASQAPQVPLTVSPAFDEDASGITVCTQLPFPLKHSIIRAVIDINTVTAAADIFIQKIFLFSIAFSIVSV